MIKIWSACAWIIIFTTSCHRVRGSGWLIPPWTHDWRDFILLSKSLLSKTFILFILTRNSFRSSHLLSPACSTLRPIGNSRLRLVSHQSLKDSVAHDLHFLGLILAVLKNFLQLNSEILREDPTYGINNGRANIVELRELII